MFQTTSIFGFANSALLQDPRRAELVAAMDDVHLLGVAREEVGLLDRGVAAADDGDALIAEERAVADRAVRDALARDSLSPGMPSLIGVPPAVMITAGDA